MFALHHVIYSFILHSFIPSSCNLFLPSFLPSCLPSILSSFKPTALLKRKQARKRGSRHGTSAAGQRPMQLSRSGPQPAIEGVCVFPGGLPGEHYKAHKAFKALIRPLRKGPYKAHKKLIKTIRAV